MTFSDAKLDVADVTDLVIPAMLRGRVDADAFFARLGLDGVGPLRCRPQLETCRLIVLSECTPGREVWDWEHLGSRYFQSGIALVMGDRILRAWRIFRGELA